MDRRLFLKMGALVPAAGAARAALAQTLVAPRPGQSWRTFEVTTTVEVKAPRGTTRVWLPVPSGDSDYQQVIGNDWTGNAGTAKVLRDGKFGAAMLYAEWPASEGAPVVVMRSRVRTRDRAVDLKARPGEVEALSPRARALYTSAIKRMPVDGVARTTARDVVGNARTDIEKARAIYEWIVTHAYRDPKVRGCGLGDVKRMLESGNLGGKCADLNGLFVCLCRAAGLPARDVYGVRLAKSALGYRSLGPATENVTRAQHCRAEVHLQGWGWVPVDPADVRKVVLEEGPAPLPLNDPLVQSARARLFGAWEMNWLAFNTANDIELPNAQSPALAFLMYPQAETAAGPLDSLDPDTFRYTITAKQIDS